MAFSQIKTMDDGKAWQSADCLRTGSMAARWIVASQAALVNFGNMRARHSGARLPLQIATHVVRQCALAAQANSLILAELLSSRQSTAVWTQ